MKVYSAHVIPLMPEEGERSYVSEFTLRDYEGYKKLLKILSEGLGRYIKNIEDKEGSKFTLEKRLKAIGDFIVAFFMLPMNLPLYPRYEEEALFPTPQEYYWSWVLSRHISIFNDEVWNRYKNLAELIEILHERLMDLAKFADITELIKEVNLDRIFSIIIKIPADTRPGLNVSKLIVHSLTTSALAVCKGLRRGLRSLEIEILRLACLLHDLGKPYQWFSDNPAKVSHATLSAKIAEEILKGILSNEILEKIKTLITYHHECNKIKERELRELCMILREADNDSSATDRIVDIVVDTVAKELGIDVKVMEEMLKRRGATVWEQWLKISDEKVRKATEIIAKKLSRKPLKIKAEEATLRDVRIIFCDLRKIQEFINVESLRALTIRSFIVDLATIYAIPRASIEVFNVNPENIIYAGGGFSILIVPDLVIERNIKRLKERYEEICGKIRGRLIAPEIVVASSPLYADWRITIEKASEELYLEKRVVNTVAPPDLIGFEKLCETCGKYPSIVEGKCDICSELERKAIDLYFQRKIEVLSSYKYRVPKWEILGEWIIEWISGNTIDEAKKEVVEERVFNISVVKVDGNFIGAFMKDAINISDAFERSVRVDRALKKGLYRILELLKNAPQELKNVASIDEKTLSEMGEEGFTKLYTGILYAGGDDALILMPTWIALPASLYIAYWFWRELGGIRQISIGIASGKPKHNIWGLLEASTYVLDNICKACFRKELSREFQTTRNINKVIDIIENTIAVIGFIYTEQQNPMRATAENIILSPLVRQPYVLKHSEYGTKLKDIREMLRIALAGKDFKESNVENELKKILVNAYIAFYNAKKGIEHPTLVARNVAREIHNIASKYAGVESDVQRYLAMLSTYVARQRVRLEEGLPKRIYIEISEYLAKTLSDLTQNKISPQEAVLPIYDIYLITKMLMGGAR